MKQNMRRIWGLPAEVAVVFYVTFNGLAGFVFRPLIHLLGRLRFVVSLGELIGKLPPYVVLVLLAVPFAIAEPAKIFAIYLIGTGHIVIGLATLCGAYILSLFVVERIYRAGEGKLLTIPWFAKLMAWLKQLRDRFLDWAKTTWAWRRAAEIKAGARDRIGRWRHQLGF